MEKVDCIKAFIGLDNGVTGTMGIIRSDGHKVFAITPIIKQQDYTKRKKNISRIDINGLWKIISENVPSYENSIVLIERPMINPTRFTASMSAIRSLESVITAMEMMGMPYDYIDSKEWQKALLPKDCSGPELKTASKDIGIRLFPQFEEMICKHKDADGILIAEYARRKYN